LAAFANLKPEEVLDFRAGMRKTSKRSRSQNVLSNFLPEICWELPAPSPPPGSPPLSEGLLGWQEIQQLVRNLWDFTLPFRSQESLDTILERLRLYSMIATLPTEEREKLRFSTLNPLPPEKDFSGQRYNLNSAGPPREPRPDEYMLLLAHVSRQWIDIPWYAERLKAEGKMPSLEHEPTTICPCGRAVWFMLFNGWRAKTCRNCRGRYIALEQQSRYCSNDCSTGNRRISNKDSRNKWWAKSGKKWRQERELARRKAKER
jgi:hypothetical protein